MIDVNRRREKDTYGKMFTPKNSVTEYVDKKVKKEPLNYRTVEDMEYEKERHKMEQKVKLQMDQKIKEFSFEVFEEKKTFPELQDVQEMIEKAEDNYKLFKKTGRIKEAKMIREKLEEALYAKEHLLHVMNLDFSRPTEKMKKIAKEHYINLRDPTVISEFKKIQAQNLEDLNRMKEGKKPLTDDELKAKLNLEREAQGKLDEA